MIGEKQLKIEAVTVCVNCADFLEAVIPYNLPMFHRWIIVTTKDDTETRELCRKYALECLVTNEGHKTGDFNKGRMIARALHHTSADGWRLHIDSDIALPRTFLKSLKMAQLHEDKIYGCDRLMIKSYEAWQKFQLTGYLDGNGFKDSHATVFSAGIEVGARWTGVHVGYVPIGFFQLWHSSQDEWRGVKVKGYPECHGSAARSDVQQALYWDRNHRELLPELIVAHIESEPCKTGTNWNGRKTVRFGPKKPVAVDDFG